MDLAQASIFDYTGYDLETRRVVQQRTSEIKALMRRTAQDIIDIGMRLADVKGRLDHGAFGPWLRCEFGLSESTALNMMQVAQAFKSVNFTDLQIAPSALYALAAPSTPEVVRREFITRAEQGETITHADVKDRIATAAQPDQTDSYDGNEWYTPAEMIAAARAALGTIDLDPASCAAAQAVVQATRYYTKQDDGLAQPWEGRVFCNPPYSQPEIEHFTTYAMQQYEAGACEAVILLVNNCTDAGWFITLAERYPVMFTRGRSKFWQINHETFAARQGQALFYLGPDPARFATAFAPLAYVPRVH